MKNAKLKFSEYMQNISRSKSFGKFVLIVPIIFETHIFLFMLTKDKVKRSGIKT